MQTSLQKITNTKSAVNFAANLRSHHPKMTWMEITQKTLSNNHSLYRDGDEDLKFAAAQLNKDGLVVYPELRTNKKKKKKRKYTKRKAKKTIELHTHGLKNPVAVIDPTNVKETISKLKKAGIDAETILKVLEVS